MQFVVWTCLIAYTREQAVYCESASVCFRLKRAAAVTRSPYTATTARLRGNSLLLSVERPQSYAASSSPFVQQITTTASDYRR